jgi:hypothetical protein
VSFVGAVVPPEHGFARVPATASAPHLGLRLGRERYYEAIPRSERRFVAPVAFRGDARAQRVASAGSFAAMAEDTTAAIRSRRTGPRGLYKIVWQAPRGFRGDPSVPFDVADLSAVGKTSFRDAVVAFQRFTDALARRPAIDPSSLGNGGGDGGASSTAIVAAADVVRCVVVCRDLAVSGVVAVLRNVATLVASVVVVATPSATKAGDAVRRSALQVIFDHARGAVAELRPSNATGMVAGGPRLVSGQRWGSAESQWQRESTIRVLESAIRGVANEFGVDLEPLTDQTPRRLQQRACWLPATTSPPRDDGEAAPQPSPVPALLDALVEAAHSGQCDDAARLYTELSNVRDECDANVPDAFAMGLIFSACATEGVALPFTDDAEGPKSGDALYYARAAIKAGVPVSDLPVASWAGLVGFCRSIVPEITGDSPSAVLTYCALEVQRCASLAGAGLGGCTAAEASVALALSLSVLQWCLSRHLGLAASPGSAAGASASSSFASMLGAFSASGNGGSSSGVNAGGGGSRSARDGSGESRYLDVEALDHVAHAFLVCEELAEKVAAASAAQLRGDAHDADQAKMIAEVMPLLYQRETCLRAVVDAVVVVMRDALPPSPTVESIATAKRIAEHHAGMIEVALRYFADPPPGSAATARDSDWILQLVVALGQEAGPLAGGGVSGEIARPRRGRPTPRSRGTGRVARVSAAAVMARLVSPVRTGFRGGGSAKRDHDAHDSRRPAAPIAAFLASVPPEGGRWQHALRVAALPSVWSELNSSWSTRDASAALDGHLATYAQALAASGVGGDVVPSSAVMDASDELDHAARQCAAAPSHLHVATSAASLLARHPDWTAAQAVAAAATPAALIPALCARLHYLGVPTVGSGSALGALATGAVFAALPDHEWRLALSWAAKVIAPDIVTARRGDGGAGALGSVVRSNAAALALAVLHRSGHVKRARGAALQLLPHISPSVLSAPAASVVPAGSPVAAGREAMDLGSHLIAHAVASGSWSVGLAALGRMRHSNLPALCHVIHHSGSTSGSALLPRKQSNSRSGPPPPPLKKKVVGALAAGELGSAIPEAVLEQVLIAQAGAHAHTANLLAAASKALAAADWRAALSGLGALKDAVGTSVAAQRPQRQVSLPEAAAFAFPATVTRAIDSAVAFSSAAAGRAVPAPAAQPTAPALQPAQLATRASSERSSDEKSLPSLGDRVRAAIAPREAATADSGAAAPLPSGAGLRRRGAHHPPGAHLTSAALAVASMEHEADWARATALVSQHSQAQRPLIGSFAAAVRACHFAGQWESGMRVASRALVAQPWPPSTPLLVASLRLSITADRPVEATALADLAWGALGALSAPTKRPAVAGAPPATGISPQQRSALCVAILAAYVRAGEFDRALRFFFAQLPHGAALDRKLVKLAVSAADGVRQELAGLVASTRVVSNSLDDAFVLTDAAAVAHTLDTRRSLGQLGNRF